ncbi:hypothetical protein ABZ639_09220 [Saccharomonospora sp. NPDC006951]
MLTGGAGPLIAGLVRGEVPARWSGSADPASLIALGYLAAVDSLAGFTLYNWLLCNTSVTLVSRSHPSVAYLTGVLALGEPFLPWILPGAEAAAFSPSPPAAGKAPGRRNCPRSRD